MDITRLTPTMKLQHIQHQNKSEISIHELKHNGLKQSKNGSNTDH